MPKGQQSFYPSKRTCFSQQKFRENQIVSFVLRRWERWRWSEREPTQAFEVRDLNGEFVYRIPRALIGEANSIDFVMYAKDPNANDGWGWFWGCSDRTVDSGIGDKYIPHYHELRLEADDAPLLLPRERYGPGGSRARIYQLFVRLFGNTNETRKRNGTLAENGVGRFADINDAALSSIREMGFTHVWLTGVLQQATATDYSDIGQPADDTDLLKGLAGSPYAIKDYFDVCPDYAVKPAERLKEFAQLIKRLHAHGLKAIIDLVPNHVARSYSSCVKPHNFGTRGPPVCASAQENILAANWRLDAWFAEDLEIVLRRFVASSDVDFPTPGLANHPTASRHPRWSGRLCPQPREGTTG